MQQNICSDKILFKNKSNNSCKGCVCNAKYGIELDADCIIIELSHIKLVANANAVHDAANATEYRQKQYNPMHADTTYSLDFFNIKQMQ